MLYSQTHDKLQQITECLQQLGMWSSTPPSPEAMASTAPFACDLMALEQWLQFIFIPRMHALMAAGQVLPSQIAIAPMAQHVWQDNPQLQPLIAVLNQLDMLLNEPR
ncbi:MAG: YqcC family protein [Shewanella sp.]